jgi:hypothetical protein
MYTVTIVCDGFTQEFENEFTEGQLMIFLKLCVTEFKADRIVVTKK